MALIGPAPCPTTWTKSFRARGLAATGHPRAALGIFEQTGTAALLSAAYAYLNLKRSGPSGYGVRHTVEDVTEGIDLAGRSHS